MTEPTDAAHRPNVRAYRAAVVSFVIATAGGIAAAIGYGTDNTGDLLGLGLAAALFGIGFGLVCWAKYLDFDEHAVQEREHLVTTPEAKEELHEELQTTGAVLGRRRMLLGLIGVSFVSLVVGFVGPIGSLGPKPRGERGRTSWRPGSRLVSLDGTPIELASPTYDQLVTVFPEGRIGVDDSQVVLLRMPPEQLTQKNDRRWRARRLGRLLQDLHPRRVLGGPVRRRQPPTGHAAPAGVPVPPIGVRSGERRRAGRRAGHAVAAATPARRRC